MCYLYITPKLKKSFIVSHEYYRFNITNTNIYNYLLRFYQQLPKKIIEICLPIRLKFQTYKYYFNMITIKTYV